MEIDCSLCKGCKVAKLNCAVTSPELGVDEEIGEDNFKIEGFYHREGRVIFLYCFGAFDSACLVQVCKRMEQDLKDKSFLDVWSDLHCTVAQSLLFLFHVSHLVLVVHPTATLDVSYVHLFRTLDNIRQKCLQSITDALKALPVSSEWVQNGRPCSPRVLFVFLSCPLEGTSSELLEVRVKTKPSKLSPIKKLEHSLEDQVYRILRKSRLPTVSVWFKVAAKLRDLILFNDSKSSVASSLKAALDVDIRFSEGRCGKVLPVASASYQENLPSHYTADFHQRKLAHAFQLFSMHARGPAFQRYAQQLREDCDAIWKAGRQMCEVLSLTGNHCVNPLHKTPENAEDESEEDSLVMPHCSQVKLISTCNCGRQQSTRDDPFILKAANYNFYLMLSAECCGVLERINFPVFEPSSAELEPCASACAPPEHFELEPRSRSRAKSLTRSQTRSDSGTRSPLSDSESDFSSESPESSDASDSRSSDIGDSEKSISLSEARTQHTEDPDDDDATKASLVPSNTEYLPGMLHSLSPAGLLPCYSAWSLVCLGPSSLYSHNIGIQDQPGFLAGTNFLLPWDVAVKFDKERWPSLWEGKRAQTWKGKKNGKGDGLQFTVKVFIGVEYECPRGHRFMCAAPDRMLRSTSTGLVKDNANKIANSHMPLYFPCPCRSVKPQVAQLMRIHVVTPKAPVHVTLQPKVQPAPHPAPTFFPGNKEPVRLSQSAYWVLRLPFVYESDAGPFLPPKDAVPVESARLLNGVYGIVEQAPIR
ncbi:protein SMG8 [Ixodes scapularis]